MRAGSRSLRCRYGAPVGAPAMPRPGRARVRQTARCRGTGRPPTASQPPRSRPRTRRTCPRAGGSARKPVPPAARRRRRERLEQASCRAPPAVEHSLACPAVARALRGSRRRAALGSGRRQRRWRRRPGWRGGGGPPRRVVERLEDEPCGQLESAGAQLRPQRTRQVAERPELGPGEAAAAMPSSTSSQDGFFGVSAKSTPHATGPVASRRVIRHPAPARARA